MLLPFLSRRIRIKYYRRTLFDIALALFPIEITLRNFPLPAAPTRLDHATDNYYRQIDGRALGAGLVNANQGCAGGVRTCRSAIIIANALRVFPYVRH